MDATVVLGRTDEQRELAAAIADLAADRCSSAQLREVIAAEPHWDPKLWSSLAHELGVTGIAIDESHGGVGGTFADAAVVIETTASALMPVPITPHLAGSEALRDCSSEDTLASLASGASIATIAVASEPGRAAHVLHGHIADVVVVAGADGLSVVRRDEPDVAVEAQPSLDLTRPHATVSFDQTARQRIGDAAAAARAIDVLRVCLAVEAVGVARRCLSMTVDYVKVREQFGRPIGSFQALQHRLSDHAVTLEAAAAASAHAVDAVDAGRDGIDELAIAAPLAKAVCCDAATTISSDTIQLHGGIGFTWEHDAHLLFKRATVLAALVGSSREQRRLVASRAGIFDGT